MDNLFRVGVDIGGTFTDLVFLGKNGHIQVRKVLSTPDDFGRAVFKGIEAFLAEEALPPAAISEIDHGTTVATNAILERKGAKVGLLTTEGFRDILELRRVRLPVLYDLTWEKPPPLVPRELRLEVFERMGPGGEVRTKLDLASARNGIEKLKDKGIESLAVCFLHSYADPSHERAVGGLAQGEIPFVSLSCDVLPELREYERTATTVVDAYIKPVVNSYLKNLREHLDAIGIGAPILVMQSNGGIISETAAANHPVHIIESGPAAGVIAAAAGGAAAGRENLITIDMGGTTAKASVIERGELTLAAEYEVGGGFSRGSRLIKGGGHLIRVPAIDISEVGAGGGSIAWVDAGGVMRVGPESAGADPGPACYGLGGERPTVTDANLILGYLNPGSLVGGDLRIEPEKAERAVARDIAEPLGLSILEAAEGIHRIANATMHRAIRSVTIERGRDPRDFTLIAFGGSGPAHAAGLARALEISAILVPPHPGVFSSFGLLVSEVEHLYTRSLLTDLAKFSPAATESVFGEMEARAREDFAAEGFSGERLLLRRFADVRYRRQIYDLLLPLPDRPLEEGDRDRLTAAFHEEHRRTYGYAMEDERLELVSLKVRAQGVREGRAALPWSGAEDGDGPRPSGGEERVVYFEEKSEKVRTPVVGRADLGEAPVEGPLIVEEYDSTTVVPPGMRVRREASGFLLLEG